MGADFFGLTRLLWKNGLRVAPSSWFDVSIDLTFSLANTGLRGLQALGYGRSVNRTELTAAPIFIIGHWRTGTTLLHELLSLDPRHRSPTTYECFLPNHFLLTERLLKSWSGFILPSTRPPDNVRMGWDKPQEDEFALCNLGVPSPYLTIAFPNERPQFSEYFELDQLSPSQRTRWKRALLTFFKQLTYRRGGRLLLKSPTHTFRLPTLHEMFPDARYINVVRNPFEIFPSTVRLWKSLYAVHGYQRPQNDGLEEFVLATFERLHERLESTRQLIEERRLVDVRYEDLVRDPVAELRSIYERLELGEFRDVEPSLRQYAAEHADYRPNRHSLSGEHREQIAQRWQAYFERYGYSLQPDAAEITS